MYWLFYWARPIDSNLTVQINSASAVTVIVSELYGWNSADGSKQPLPSARQSVEAETVEKYELLEHTYITFKSIREKSKEIAMETKLKFHHVKKISKEKIGSLSLYLPPRNYSPTLVYLQGLEQLLIFWPQMTAG